MPDALNALLNNSFQKLGRERERNDGIARRSLGSPLPLSERSDPCALGRRRGWFVIPSPSQGSKGDGRCHKRNQWPELKKMALYVSPLLLLRLRCPASEVLVWCFRPLIFRLLPVIFLPGANNVNKLHSPDHSKSTAKRSPFVWSSRGVFGWPAAKKFASPSPGRP
ncbi:hypothetical protein CDAR_419031 [Caerostris darwini]|uniref:Uncharacterized protein n=1 Tax=Caerostris darwini TaxID=1538125 RepID=A0AAV4MZI3_9ARAC|nr:hypothetical protein CDAR_419031 [Caerostris darwini]